MSLHIHRLSKDNAWLLTLSNNPHGHLSTDDNTLTFLLDPWLSGPESDLHPWFITQHHSASKPPQFPDYESLAEFLASDPRKAVDGVIISFEGDDHVHKKTIDGIDPELPFFALAGAAKKLRGWGRKYVYEIPKGPGEMSIIQQMCEAERRRSGSDNSRREFLESVDVKLGFISTTATPWEDLVQDLIRGVLVFSFSKGSGSENIAAWKSRQDTTTEVFAFLAGWDVVRLPWALGGITNGGIPDNSKIVSVLSPRYWLRTHDEETFMSGFVSFFIRREVWSKERAESELEMTLAEEIRTKLLDMDPGEVLGVPFVSI
ncbi:hypothetical protein L218DRAFT_963461 [Marasmius fiardii PR-910]|nr:hypothetical protein L218DRAFT_963461 [Marasmius fiardii PR-910]